MLTSSIQTAHIGVVGAGRLGTALSHALRAGGLCVSGPHGRGAVGEGSDIVLLCVPDAAIASAARMVRDGALVGHTSGATTLAPLGSRESFSIHPLLSVARDRTSFAGAGCAIAGSTVRASAVAAEIASALGMRTFEVADADRALYHAAASLASNYLVTLEGAAEALFAAAGVSREHIAPLVRSAAEQWEQRGARAALTGPVVRGDEETIMRQTRAIADRAPDLLALWDTLTRSTRALAARGGVHS